MGANASGASATARAASAIIKPESASVIPKVGFFLYKKPGKFIMLQSE